VELRIKARRKWTDNEEVQKQVRNKYFAAKWKALDDEDKK
jgi:hypothetical protein